MQDHVLFKIFTGEGSMESPQQVSQRLRRFAKQLEAQAESARRVPWPSTLDIDTTEMLATALLERLDGKHETLDSALGLAPTPDRASA